MSNYAALFLTSAGLVTDSANHRYYNPNFGSEMTMQATSCARTNFSGAGTSLRKVTAQMLLKYCSPSGYKVQVLDVAMKIAANTRSYTLTDGGTVPALTETDIVDSLGLPLAGTALASSNFSHLLYNLMGKSGFGMDTTFAAWKACS